MSDEQRQIEMYGAAAKDLKNLKKQEHFNLGEAKAIIQGLHPEINDEKFISVVGLAEQTQNNDGQNNALSQQISEDEALGAKKMLLEQRMTMENDAELKQQEEEKTGELASVALGAGLVAEQEKGIPSLNDKSPDDIGAVVRQGKGYEIAENLEKGGPGIERELRNKTGEVAPAQTINALGTEATHSEVSADDRAKIAEVENMLKSGDFINKADGAGGKFAGAGVQAQEKLQTAALCRNTPSPSGQGAGQVKTQPAL